MVDGGPSDSLSTVNMTPQQLQNSTLSISLPFLTQANGSLGVEGDQGVLTRQSPDTSVWNLPPPPCLMNTFIQAPQLAPSDASSLQQATSSHLPIGSFVPENTVSNTFFHDLWHHRGYPGLLNLPPAFQIQPNMQNQIQNDLNQHGQMIQPQGFLPGYIPTDTNVAAIVQQHGEPNSRASHPLQPNIRHRARRRSRASRALQHHAQQYITQHQLRQERRDVEDGGVNLRSRTTSEVPITRIPMTEAEGEYGDINVMVTDSTPTRLDDSKLKGIEEPYTITGENFECNICFQRANEPIVTCCGHLFCWPCVYRWLHIHSYHKECPVCKGAIDEKSVIPIYGRECSGALSTKGRLPEGSTTEHIPPRPSARRVESARQLQEREDRIRMREQRERALERSQNVEQQDANGSPDIIQITGTGSQAEEETTTIIRRDNLDDPMIQSITEIEDEIINQETIENSN
ncbi:hypothetical protein R1flu_028340 [Riccia fluitans]|uniref:RING-type E3 ubiquitin transferase n=1 Tax=Riccia fluitans TaxID=41844 RepID=A0ABD1XLF0_9MARC